MKQHYTIASGMGEGAAESCVHVFTYSHTTPQQG